MTDFETIKAIFDKRGVQYHVSDDLSDDDAAIQLLFGNMVWVPGWLNFNEAGKLIGGGGE